MNKRQRELLGYFERNSTWITAGKLSQLLDVSDRTIRNDIQIINAELGHIIISSKSFGYKLKKFSEMNTSMQDNQFDSYERLTYIYIQCVKNINAPVDYFQFCDELFISESTLMSSISALKKMIDKVPIFNIKLVKKAGVIKLEGYLSNALHFLYYVFKNNYKELKIEYIQKFFTQVDLSILQSYINTLLGKDYDSKYCTSFEILINIAVLLESYHKNTKTIFIEKEYLLLDDFIHLYDFINRINHYYELSLTKADCLVFVESILKPKEFENNEKQLRKKIELQDTSVYDVKLFIKSLLFEIDESYHINLNSRPANVDEFINHIIIAIERTKNSIYYYNPLKESIYKDFPFMYDLALILAEKINEYFEIKLSDDEITLFVIHFSQFTDINFELQKHITLYIYTSLGMSINNFLAKKISYVLPSYEIIILKDMSLAAIKDINDNYGVLLYDKLTDIMLPEASFRITNSLNTNELQLLNNYLSELYTRSYKKTLDSIFHAFFSKEFFFVHEKTEQLSKDKLLYTSCKILENRGYVDHTFYESVCLRESLNTTEQPSGVAIPHPTYLMAKKSVITVNILTSSIQWEQEKIKIMLLFAISPTDQEIVHQFYSLLTKIINKKENIGLLAKARSFQEFSKIFYSLSSMS